VSVRAVELFFMTAGVVAVVLTALGLIVLLEGGRNVRAWLPQFSRLPPPGFSSVKVYDDPFDARHEKPEPGERVLFYASGRWHVGELIEMHGRRPGWWDGSSWFAAENVRWWIELPAEPQE
jgi:hypothetical protein